MENDDGHDGVHETAGHSGSSEGTEEHEKGECQDSLAAAKSTMRGKVWEWLSRYVPLEIAGTTTALVGGMTAYYMTGGSEIAGAVAGAWCENIGFYGTAATREMIHYARQHAGETKWWKYPVIFLKSLRNLVAEFGPAEACDTVLIRPAFMYSFQRLFDSAPLGILAGKLAADVVFYGIAVTAYEIRKVLWKD